MHLMLIGAPASGKGTQAKLLTEYFKIDHISTGDMLRAAVSERTELGQVIETYLKHGWLVPDHHVMQLVEDRLAHDDITNGFILDGFPRTLSQARAFDECLHQRGLSLDVALFIDASDDVVLERVTGRRTDPQTEEIYHLKFNPPPPEILDRLVQREDDTEAVMRERLATYHQEITPVLKHYDHQNLSLKVNGSAAPDEVFKEILRLLESIPQKG
jgi:adenylate kinase